MSLSSFSMAGRGHDVIAVFATLAATLSVHKLSDWLQVAVLVLTIVFIALGIVMRILKIRNNSDDD